MLSAAELNTMTCSNPSCTHRGHPQLYLHGTCHPRSAAWVRYEPARQALIVECAQCDGVIVEIAVAAHVPPAQPPQHGKGASA